jgi:hypothetical protein
VSRAGRRRLWALIAAGTIVRLGLAATTDGLAFDVGSFHVVRRALADHGLDLYSFVNGPGGYRWPYPPTFLAWIEASAGLSRVAGGGYVLFIQLAPIAADAALAWLVAAHLAWRGATQRTCLVAGGLVALGPIFVLISGYAVQIDSVAVLPAAGALAVWTRLEGPDRAWKAGLLVGLAASIKTVPALVVLALLPTGRGWREGAVLLGAAVLVPLVAILPFLIADLDGVREMLRYNGVPGLGGLTLAVQPDLAEFWLRRPVGYNGANAWIADHQRLVNAVMVLGAGGFLLVRRMAPERAAVVLWLVVWAFGTGFFFQYLVWGLPFLLLAGHLRAAGALQVVMLLPAVLFYAGPWRGDDVVIVFVAVMLAVWLAWLVGLVAVGRARGAPVPAGAP